MSRRDRLEHRFVKHIPDRLEPGVLYVSMEFATSAHSCCCGCGEEVVVPFTPTSWKLTFDGESISLWPSVGNWELRCNSHYIIEGGRVRWAGAWSDQQIEAERRRDKAAKQGYYDTIDNEEKLPVITRPVEPTLPAVEPGWWARMRRWFIR